MAADGTEFLIEIATRLAGAGDATAALAELGNRMVAAGATAAQLDSAVSHARSALESTSAAASAAASAVAAGQQQYDQLAVALDRSAKAAERAAAKNGGVVPEDAAARVTAARAALEAQAAVLDELRAKSTAAAAANDQMAATLGNLEGAAERAAAAEEKATRVAHGTGEINALGEAFGKLGGPIGAAGQKIVGLTQASDKMSAVLGAGVGPAVAIAAAVLALTAAVIAGTIALAKWAVGLADANRSASLMTEAISRTSANLAGLGTILPDVARATGLTKDELAGLAQQLDAAGVSASDMPAALRAVATAEAALGKGAAAQLVADLKAGKKSAAELAAEMDKKFGDIVAKKMLSLDAQTRRLKSNLGETFGGLNIEPLLAGLSKVVDLFDASTASGKALKFLFESLFQPLIDAAAAALPSIEAFFLGMAIGALKVWIAVKPIGRAIMSVVGALGGVDSSTMVTLGKVAGVLAVVFGVLAAVVAGVVVASIALFVGFLALPIALITALVAGIGWLASTIYGALAAAFNFISSAGASAWDGLKAAFDAALAWLASLSLADVGANIITSLAEGIMGAAGAVVSAVTGAVGGAIDAAKSLLGISSPSKVFGEMGAQTAAGFEGGVDAGAGGARSALEGMVEAPDGGGGNRGSSGPAINLSGATFVFNGVKNAEDAEGMFEALLTRLLEGDVAQIGGEAPA